MLLVSVEVLIHFLLTVIGSHQHVKLLNAASKTGLLSDHRHPKCKKKQKKKHSGHISVYVYQRLGELLKGHGEDLKCYN